MGASLPISMAPAFAEVVAVHVTSREVVSADGAGDTGEPSTLEEIEGRFIRDVLARNSWNRTAAARELGIHKTTLHRKIRRLGLELPEIDGRSARGNARG